MILTGIGEKTFLRKYWQQQPVLLRQALPDFVDPLSPEDLAGLACEAEVESRLVFTKAQQWSLRTGPFRERDFTSLPKRNWTLLVQAVDQWVPAVKALLATVPFLPSWRVDDVMISYATANGGVGPHFDYYDVFLVQGQGSRLWRTGQRCTAADELRTDSGLKLLKQFHTEQQWQLHSGDVLYVPPGIAHWGVSVDDSLCYSIGFRAPSASDMVLGFSDEVAAHLSPDLRFTDPLRPLPLAAGEITAADLWQAKQLLQAALQDESALARWLGTQMTQPRYPELIQPAGNSRKAKPQVQVTLHAASRLAWLAEQGKLRVFVDGESHLLTDTAGLRRCLQSLCSGQAVTLRQLGTNNASRHWCQLLLQQGSLLLY
jgi:50S ribosomal protein L16 3-hydroxylase